MLRSTFAVMLGAAFGAVCHDTIRERVQDLLWQPVEICTAGLIAGAAGLIALLIMPLREYARPKHDCGAELLRRAKAQLPSIDYACLVGDYSNCTFADTRRPGGGYQPIHDGSARPTPPTSGSGIQPPRDRDGRFVKKN